MTIYSTHAFLPALAAARAEATGRAWYLVQDTTTCRVRLTDDPSGDHKAVITQVFSPPQAIAAA